MRLPLALAGLALLATGLTAPASAQAGAAAYECQGKPATIVDPDGGQVVGTDGDDVVLAAGESDILTGKGDDTICLQEGYVFAGSGRDAVFVAGDVDREYLDIRDAEDLDITVGPGGGFVQLVPTGQRGAGRVDVTGGAFLRLIGTGKVAVDLEDDLLEMGRGSYTLQGNPDIFAVARRVVLVGDAADNDLAINQGSCRITMMGGRGADELTVAGSDGDLPFPENCGPSPSRVYGQRGNDLLQGRAGSDILIGGPGRDEARGGFGTDTCRAEKTRNCER